MTVDRVVLSPAHGLKVSKAGVAVKTASQSNLLFSSENYSAPLLWATTKEVGSDESTQYIYFPQTYSSVPSCHIYVTGEDPSATNYASLTLIEVGDIMRRKRAYGSVYNDIKVATGSYAYLFIQLYNNRIELKNYVYGNDVDGYSRYVRVILYDFVLTGTA